MNCDTFAPPSRERRFLHFLEKISNKRAAAFVNEEEACMSSSISQTHQQVLLDALHRHEQRLLNYAISLCHDYELAQDAVQDAFIRLAQESPRLAPGDFGAWLFTVCRNRIIDLQRRSRRIVPLGDAHEDEPDSAAPPDAAAQLRDDAEQLLALVEKLPEAQREVVRLRYLGGLSYQEIAHITNQSTGSVGWLLHEALRTLRQQCKSLAFAP